MNYALGRVFYAVSLWLGVVIGTFFLFHLVPTDPVRTMLGPNASEAQVDTVRGNLGLDKPISGQFVDYLGRVAVLDFGRSYIDNRPIGREIREKLAITASLAVIAVLFIVLYLAVSVALELSKRFKWLSRFTDSAFVSLPTLFIGVVIALMVVEYYPYTRFTGDLGAIGDWLYLIPPAAVLALYPMGVLGQIVNEQMGRAKTQDFVRAARGRGLQESVILRGYVFRNSLVPLMAAFGNQLPLLLTSTFIVEMIFSVPGIGALLLRSVLERDLPMLEAIIIVTALLSIVTTTLLELTYPLADPRIRKYGVS